MTSPEEIVDSDCEELRDIAKWFSQNGKIENATFLLAVAQRYEIVAGAYSASSKQILDAANKECIPERQPGRWMDTS